MTNSWYVNFATINIILVAQTIKNLPAMQETQIRSLGQEDPLKKEMATTLVFFGKDPNDGEDWGQEEKGAMKEEEMVEWYHQLNGHEFEQTLGDSEWLGSLACCSPWDDRVGHNWATEQTNKKKKHLSFNQGFSSPIKNFWR